MDERKRTCMNARSNALYTTERALGGGFWRIGRFRRAMAACFVCLCTLFCFPVSALAAEVPDGLVDLRELDQNWIIDMRYATENNSRGVAFYETDDCFLREGTAKKLVKAQEYLEERGYRLVILDAYRPQRVQQWLWDNCPQEDRKYLANPKKGSNHTRGNAVDVTLADSDGVILEMQSEYDDVTEKATRKYAPEKQLKQRTDILTKAMKKAGFKAIDLEWWHYSDSKYYSLIKESG